MVQFLKVLALAVVQGLTEFLPVSSSGHLVLAEQLLGLQPPGASLEVFLHSGTLVAILVYYRHTLGGLARDAAGGCPAAWRRIGVLLLSSLPAVALYVCAKGTLETAFERPEGVGPALCVTGLLLLFVRFSHGKRSARQERKTIRWRDAAWIGLAQALALLPGISRSGSTISVARLHGIAPAAAAEFSFLMCIPLLIGATLLELGKACSQGTGELPWTTLFAGALVAGAVGYAALGALVRMLQRDTAWRFGIYCLALGLGAMWKFGF